ncbi:MAG: hypothetical protein DRG63_00040 [Deltaproteobacteria bacterium]|nr:MAG: hypothetical protein DRG63_00040 [Deltaproteobacteria bacterium]
MKRGFVLLLIPCILTLAGCLPSFQRPAPPLEAKKALLPPVDESLVKERVRHLKELMERKDLTPPETRIFNDLLNTYQSMTHTPSALGEREYYRTTIRRLFQSLSSLEDLYVSQRPPLGKEEASVVRLFSEKTHEVLDAYLSGNYKAVIDKCIDLKDTFGPYALTPEVGLVFALSLAEQGMVKDAIAIGEQIANRLQTRPDLMALRSHLVKWHLDLGDKDGAVRNYEKLTDLLDEKRMAAQGLAAVIGQRGAAKEKEGEQKGQPIAPAKPSVSEPVQAAGVPPLEEFLTQIRQLMAERKFELARDLIKKRRHRTISQKELARLEETLKEVDQQEDLFLQQRISELSIQSKSLKEAEALIEKEHYDEALTKLDRTFAEHGENAEVSALRDKAIEGIINRERNKAAKLFLAAKNSPDPVKKERYLRSCLEILKALVDKYPSSPLILKVKDHIQRVTEELEKLG